MHTTGNAQKGHGLTTGGWNPKHQQMKLCQSILWKSDC